MKNFSSQVYNDAMEKLSDELFGLDLDFDLVAGEGDIVVDDILISVAEEENFEQRLDGKRYTYIIIGKTI